MNQLKTIYHCHLRNGMLDSDLGGKALTVLDLDISDMEDRSRVKIGKQ
ncbi:MAG: hypothetical protein AB1665_03870 [Candidatus Thermoplasmatota archaeon]